MSTLSFSQLCQALPRKALFGTVGNNGLTVAYPPLKAPPDTLSCSRRQTELEVLRRGGSSYLIIIMKEVGLKNHICCGPWEEFPRHIEVSGPSGQSARKSVVLATRVIAVCARVCVCVCVRASIIYTCHSYIFTYLHI